KQRVTGLRGPDTDGWALECCCAAVGNNLRRYTLFTLILALCVWLGGTLVGPVAAANTPTKQILMAPMRNGIRRLWGRRGSSLRRRFGLTPRARDLAEVDVLEGEGIAVMLQLDGEGAAMADACCLYQMIGTKPEAVMTASWVIRLAVSPDSISRKVV